MNIEELIDNICTAEYQYISEPCRETRTSTVVSRYSSSAVNERAAIAEAVYKWFASNQEYQDAIKLREEISELKASIYVYEKIIANSNFRPLIQGNEHEREETDENSNDRRL